MNESINKLSKQHGDCIFKYKKNVYLFTWIIQISIYLLPPLQKKIS